jgi:hypothetical protein
MGAKRILVLSSKHGDTPAPKSTIHQVVSCSNTDEALNILMGGSAAFGAGDYAKTGKVRPDVLVMDSSYLDTFEGLELLEIIRKYYSLQNVRIFISAKNPADIDPAVYRRYKISGHLPIAFNLDSLQSEAAGTAGGQLSAAGGTSLSAGFVGTHGNWGTSVIEFIKGKSFLFNLAKTITTGKAAFAASCLVVTSAFVAINTDNSVHKKHLPAQAIKAAPVITLVTAPEPASGPVIVAEKPLITEPAPSKQTRRSVKKPVQKITEKKAVTPQSGFKIMVVADEEPETANAQ